MGKFIVTAERVVNGAKITSRVNHELAYELWKVRGCNSRTIHLPNHELTNAVFWSEHSQENVIFRNIYKQWDDNWVIKALYENERGSSGIAYLSYCSEGSIEIHGGSLENFKLIKRADVPFCVYCNALVENETHFKCGNTRNYHDHENPDEFFYTAPCLKKVWETEPERGVLSRETRLWIVN